MSRCAKRTWLSARPPIMKNATRRLGTCPGHGYDPTQRYNTLLQGLASQGDVETSIKFFDEMKSKHIKPDKLTFHCVVSACCNANQRDKAISFLNEMKLSGLTPTIDTYNVIFSVLARGKDFERMDDFLRIIKGEGIHPTSLTYHMICSAYCASNYPDSARAYLDEMLVDGIDASATASVILESYVRSEEQTKVERMLHLMNENRILPTSNAIECIVSDLKKKRSWERIIEFVHEMDTIGARVNIPTFEYSIEACLSCGRTKKARELVKLMRDRGMEPAESLVRSVEDANDD